MLLRIEEVALRLGVSTKTIQNWYSFKKEKPDNELAKQLPDYIQHKERQTRYWKDEDLWKLIEFKKNLPRGRYGLMACVTQKYVKKKEKKDDSNR